MQKFLKLPLLTVASFTIVLYNYLQKCFHFRLVIEIFHSATLGVFTVVGTGGNAHAVRLYPSTGLCYHIMAVKLSIGMNVSPDLELRKVNLTQLRRNITGRKDKKSGRKKPCIAW